VLLHTRVCQQPALKLEQTDRIGRDKQSDMQLGKKNIGVSRFSHRMFGGSVLLCAYLMSKWRHLHEPFGTYVQREVRDDSSLKERGGLLSTSQASHMPRLVARVGTQDGSKQLARRETQSVCTLLLRPVERQGSFE